MPDRFTHEEHGDMLNHIHDVFAENKRLLAELTEAREEIRRVRAELQVKEDKITLRNLHSPEYDTLRNSVVSDLEHITAEITTLKDKVMV
jgi:hypothetical protein